MTDFAFEPLDIAACNGTGFTAKAISYGQLLRTWLLPD